MHVQQSNCICHGRTKTTFSKLLEERNTSTKPLQERPVEKVQFVARERLPLPISLRILVIVQSTASNNRHAVSQSEQESSKQENTKASRKTSEQCPTNEVRRQYSSSPWSSMLHIDMVRARVYPLIAVD